MPIFSIGSLATFVQFLMFWNRIFFSECFDNVDFFSSFGVFVFSGPRCSFAFFTAGGAQKACLSRERKRGNGIIGEGRLNSGEAATEKIVYTSRFVRVILAQGPC